MMFSGLYTALITPFDAEGKFDKNAFENIIEAQISAGVTGIVAVGTTGESPTTSHEEDYEIISTAVVKAAGRIRVIAGTGSNCTETAVQSTRMAQKLGADAALVVVPYYNKPTQQGLFLHFEAVAKSSPEFPIILYDVPGRTGVKMSTETILALAQIPNIVGIKVATGNLEDAQNLIGKVPTDFSILSGDDDLTVDLIASGGHGVISVASNLCPAKIQNLLSSALIGDMTTAKKRDTEMKELFSLCFCESNPIPIKFLMAESGKCQPVFRLPLCLPSEENQEKLRSFLKTFLESEKNMKNMK